MLSFEPLLGFVDKMVFEIVEGQPGRGVHRVMPTYKPQ